MTEEERDMLERQFNAGVDDLVELGKHWRRNTDRKILSALTGPYRSKPIGLDNLAAFLNMEPSTIEANEGFLVRSGLVTRTGRGRAATADAYELMKEAS